MLSKLVDVVTFADVDAEDNSVVQIMKFGRITRPKFLKIFLKTSSTRIGRDFDVDVKLRC